MSAPRALAILDSMFDLFKQMSGGIALDLQWLEISRRLALVRAEVVWSADLDFHATKLKARSAFYAATYRPSSESDRIRRSNADKLDKIVEEYVALRAHLEQQLPPA